MNIGSIIKGEITSLAFGGKGILRHNNFVIFVPFTAIGDLITCEITKLKKSFGEGELVEILQPSPQRVTPRCPYFGKCGGCQLQHLNYEAQLKYKHQAVEDAFHRLGKLKEIEIPPVMPAVQQWHYRRRVNLKLRPNTNGELQAGYITLDNTTLLPVTQCQIFVPENNPIIQIVQTIAASLEAPPEISGHVTILKELDNRFILHFSFNKAPDNAIPVFENAAKNFPEISFILLSSPKKNWSIGNLTCELKIEDLTFRFSPEAFIQNHPEQSLNIYREILEITKKSPSDNILDLYCGIGISSLLIARHKKKVIGIESNASAIALAKENQKFNQISNVEFFASPVESIQKNKWNAPLIIVNPPRIGMSSSATQSLIKANPKEIIYISCMPSTLARDLEILTENNYEIVKCAVYDMFPQTAHVETLVYLRK